MTLREMATYISTWREAKGFYTPESLNTEEERDLMLGKLMLVVTELSEAAEAVRHNDFENFKEELADAFIRLLDICGTLDIDIEAEIHKKMHKNQSRPLRHGTHCSL